MSSPGFSAILGEMSHYPTVVAVSLGWLGCAGGVSSVLSLSLTSVSLCAAEIHWYWLVIVSPWGSCGVERGSRWHLI